MSLADHDWNRLVGRTVRVRAGGRPLRDGEVEEVSKDSTMMWLRFDGVHRRQLIMKEDDYEILLLDESEVWNGSQDPTHDQHDGPCSGERLH